MAVLAAYSFDEAGTVVVDYADGHDFTLSGTNGVRTASGHTNGGLTKNGTGMVDVAMPPFGQTANRTVMCWARGNGTTWYVQWYVASIDSGSWGILSLDGVNVGAQARNAAGFVRALAPIPAGGDWHHYAATYDGSNVRFYIDGVLAATTALTGPLRTDATELQIMEWTNGATIIDDLRILDEALDQAAIVELMNTPVTGAPEITGTLAATAPAATSSMAAEVPVAGALDVGAPAAVASLDGEVTLEATLTAIAPAATVEAVGETATAGPLNATAPAPVATFSAIVSVSGVLSAMAPAASFHASSGVAFTFTVADVQDGWAVQEVPLGWLVEEVA